MPLFFPVTIMSTYSGLLRTFIQSAKNDGGTTANAYTYSSVNLGAAAADRYILVGSGGINGSSNVGISSVSIGGVSATELFDADPGPNGVTLGFHIALVPTGTTGDIIVTYASSMLRGGICVWALRELLSTTPVDTASAFGSPPSAGSIDASVGGGVFGLAVGQSVTFGWTGVDEDEDSTVMNSLNKIAAGSKLFSSAVSNEAIHAAPSSGTAQWAFVSLR